MTPLAVLVALIAKVRAAHRRLCNGEGFNLAGVDAALARLEATSYGAAAARATVEESAARVVDGLDGIPSWFKTAADEFNAADQLAPPVEYRVTLIPAPKPPRYWN